MFVTKKPLVRFSVIVLIAVLFLAAGMAGAKYRMALIGFLSPLQKAFQSTSNNISGFFQSIRELRSLQIQNDRLAEENIHLKNAIIELEEHKIANERLRKLLEFKQQSVLKLLPAEIIGQDVHLARFTIIINKGRNHGIEKRMTVVAAEGLVGSVIEAGTRTSQVMLISDYDSRTSAMIQETREQGIVSGNPFGELIMKYLGRDAKVSINDLVISSGMGGVFMKGLVIGRIQDVSLDAQGLQKEARILSVVNFAKLEEVFVILELQE